MGRFAVREWSITALPPGQCEPIASNVDCHLIARNALNRSHDPGIGRQSYREYTTLDGSANDA